jgi:cytoskeletal protein CcmA (bactofilin family)
MAVRPVGWRRLVLGSGAPAPPEEPARVAPAPVARVERGCEMQGRLVTEQPLEIDGEFRGELESASSVVVSATGSVEAPIRARSVEIHGAVVGDVVASREVVVHPTGRLHGAVDAPSLVILRGAFFNGSARMYRPERVVQAEAEALPAAE